MIMILVKYTTTRTVFAATASHKDIITIFKW